MTVRSSVTIRVVVQELLSFCSAGCWRLTEENYFKFGNAGERVFSIEFQWSQRIRCQSNLLISKNLPVDGFRSLLCRPHNSLHEKLSTLKQSILRSLSIIRTILYVGKRLVSVPDRLLFANLLDVPHHDTAETGLPLNI